MMPTGFDTNDPTVLASLDNILALTEAGDDLAGRGLPTCGLADLESVALSRHDADRACQLVGAALQRAKEDQQ